jgi:hypothetical protein
MGGQTERRDEPERSRRDDAIEQPIQHGDHARKGGRAAGGPSAERAALHFTSLSFTCNVRCRVLTSQCPRSQQFAHSSGTGTTHRQTDRLTETDTRRRQRQEGRKEALTAIRTSSAASPQHSTTTHRWREGKDDQKGTGRRTRSRAEEGWHGAHRAMGEEGWTDRCGRMEE